MIDWLIQNKEWLFSGAGISGLAVLVWVIRTAFNRRNLMAGVQSSLPAEPQPTQMPQLLEEIEPRELPLGLFEVMAEVHSRPPYQQKEAKSHYIGFRTEITGTLASAKEAGDMIHFSVSPKNSPPSFCLVFCMVPKTECPELKVAHKGWPLRVQGILADFDSDSAELKQVRVLECGEARIL
jgi:hypothetical protein